MRTFFCAKFHSLSLALLPMLVEGRTGFDPPGNGIIDSVASPSFMRVDSKVHWITLIFMQWRSKKLVCLRKFCNPPSI